MHLRHADSSSVRPRGKKLGVADPDLGVDVAATRARPGNCTPASPPPHGDGSPATAAPDTDPNPTPLGLLMELLDPMTPVRVSHHLRQRRLGTEVAPKR